MGTKSFGTISFTNALFQPLIKVAGQIFGHPQTVAQQFRFMAEFTFSCPQCRQAVLCDVNYAGSQITCPLCQSPIVVPPPSATTPIAADSIQIKKSTLKTIGAIAAVIVLLTALAAGGWYFYLQHSYPRLGGDWKMGGPYNVGKACQIIQSGKALTFVNENGNESRGEFKDKSAVVALDWEGGLNGKLNKTATRINWRNGTWWIREK